MKRRANCEIEHIFKLRNLHMEDRSGMEVKRVSGGRAKSLKMPNEKLLKIFNST